eukprot:TRINITY_DN3352_c0_g2_i1.p1 TRINITY_DN3352_c0_g2~~TRINITY_DN3352_c0_g2_i1.p1  ORF type:complete len:232 (-),score=51.67 TRINITY_DN3352_c0_g2_i1:190-885(-)
MSNEASSDGEDATTIFDEHVHLDSNAAAADIFDAHKSESDVAEAAFDSHEAAAEDSTPIQDSIEDTDQPSSEIQAISQDFVDDGGPAEPLGTPGSLDAATDEVQAERDRRRLLREWIQRVVKEPQVLRQAGLDKELTLLKQLLDLDRFVEERERLLTATEAALTLERNVYLDKVRQIERLGSSLHWSEEGFPQIRSVIYQATDNFALIDLIRDGVPMSPVSPSSAANWPSP